jgi:hypothetical protein
MPSVIQTFPNVSFFVTSLARKFAPFTEFRDPLAHPAAACGRAWLDARVGVLAIAGES